MPARRRIALLAIAAAASACAATPEEFVHDTSVDPGYRVKNNQVLDKNGAVHYFHGVDRPTLEWSPDGERISLSDFKNMAAWKANVVRIALNQDNWLFGNVAKGYRATVKQAVEWAKRAGLDVILDLHWSDQGGAVAAAQQKMADANSITFWKEVAEFYRDDGRVLFELYNEPHDITWEVWLNGGSAGNFTAVGMQQLYDTVRATGAKNLVIAGGLDWAYDLSGVATHRIQGENIMYATHPYSRNDWKPVSSFDEKWGFLTATDPVIVSEFGDNPDQGCTTDYTPVVIDYADRRGASWTAWGWYPKDCQFPSLIADWSGRPSAMGQVVKDALARYASQGMPVTEDGGVVLPKLPDAISSDIPGGSDLAPAVDLADALDLAPRATDTGAPEAGRID
jgi:endoglucanase